MKRMSINGASTTGCTRIEWVSSKQWDHEIKEKKKRSIKNSGIHGP